MADLTGQQLKNSYQNLVTIDATIESNPTSGQLENGLGNPITALGIGTDSPSTELHILNSIPILRIESSSGGQEAQLHLDAHDNNGTAGLYFTRVSDVSDNYAKIGWTGGTSGDMYFTVDAQERMRIDSSGNVGIGQTNPQAKLQVGTGADAHAGTGTGQICISGAGQTIAVADKPAVYHRNGVGLGLYSDAQISFEVNGSTSKAEAMRIDSSGNVGIGTTSPAEKIHIQDGNIRVDNSNGAHIGNQDGVTVTTSATTIASTAGDLGRLWVVNGISSGDRFCDLVMASTSVSPVVVQSFTSAGSPSARTYTRSGVALQLAMASGSYTVSCISFGRS